MPKRKTQESSDFNKTKSKELLNLLKGKGANGGVNVSYDRVKKLLDQNADVNAHLNNINLLSYNVWKNQHRDAQRITDLLIERGVEVNGDNGKSGALNLLLEKRKKADSISILNSLLDGGAKFDHSIFSHLYKFRSNNPCFKEIFTRIFQEVAKDCTTEQLGGIEYLAEKIKEGKLSGGKKAVKEIKKAANGVVDDEVYKMAAAVYSLQVLNWDTTITLPLVVIAKGNEPNASEILTALLDRGVDVDAQDKNGMTALMHVVKSAEPNDSEVLTVLLDRGADINVQDQNGMTALMHVAQSAEPNASEVLAVLLDRGADVNMQDKKGKTPAMYATQSNAPEVLTVLLNRGARADIKDDLGRTVVAHSIVRRSYLPERDNKIRKVLQDKKIGVGNNDTHIRLQIIKEVEEGLQLSTLPDDVPDKLMEMIRFWGQDQIELEEEVLADSINKTIEIVSNFLKQKGILAKDDSAQDQGLPTDRGLTLFTEDLLGTREVQGRIDTEFVSEIPNYMNKFMQYIALILSTDSKEKQISLLTLFPPDDREEYQCNDGAGSRLNTAYSHATGSFAIKIHSQVTEGYLQKLLEVVPEEYEVHIQPFINYLLGIDKSKIGDNMLAGVVSDITAQQAFDMIKNYDKQYLENYLETTNHTIKKIIDVIKKDNEEGKFSVSEIKGILKEDLLFVDADGVGGNPMDNIMRDLYGDSSGIAPFWTEEPDEEIKKKLSESIKSELSKVSNIFSYLPSKIDTHIVDSGSIVDMARSNSLRAENLNEFDFNEEQIGAIYALRVLAEGFRGSKPLPFLVESDHIFGQKDRLLQISQDDAVLQRYINRIFERREVHLGDSWNGVEREYPLHFAIYRQDTAEIQEILEDERKKNRYLNKELKRQGSSRRGLSPLQAAIDCNNPDATQLLLDAGLEISDVGKRVVLAWSIEHKYQDIVERFAENGTRSELKLAMEYNNPDAIRSILDNGLEIIDVVKRAVLAWSIKYKHQDIVERFAGDSSQNILKLAINCNNSDAVRSILDAGLEVSNDEKKVMLSWSIKRKHQDIVGRFAGNGSRNEIHLAIRHGNPEAIKLLMDSGVAIGKEDVLDVFNCSIEHKHQELTQLFMGNAPKNTMAQLIEYDRPDTMQFLIESGWAVSKEDRSKIFNYSIKHKYSQLVKAVVEEVPKDRVQLFLRNNNPDAIKFLVDAGLGIDDDDKKTILRWSIAHKHQDLVDSFAEKGSKGELRLAIQYGNPDAVKSLVDAGLKVSDGDKKVMLEWSIKHKYQGVVEMFAENGSANEVQMAMEHSNPEATKLLLDAGIEVDGDSKGRILRWSASIGHKELAECVLDKGADINAKSSQGLTPLHNAIRTGNVEMVDLLLEREADVSVLDSCYKINALNYLIEHEHQETAKVLIEVNDSMQSMEYLMENKKPNIIKFLLESGVEVSDEEKGRVLRWSASWGYKELAECVLDKGADINAKSSQGLTPLLNAVEAGSVEMVDLLLERKADTSILNSDAKTPLEILPSVEIDNKACHKIASSIFIDKIKNNQELNYGEIEIVNHLLSGGLFRNILKEKLIDQGLEKNKITDFFSKEEDVNINSIKNTMRALFQERRGANMVEMGIESIEPVGVSVPTAQIESSQQMQEQLTPPPAELSGQAMMRNTQLDGFNEVTNASNLTHQNVENLARRSFLGSNPSASEETNFHSMFTTATIGGDGVSDSLRDSILKFIGQDQQDHMAIALCQGNLNAQIGQIEGNTHWTGLCLKKEITDDDQIWITPFFMNSSGNTIPTHVRDVLRSIDELSTPQDMSNLLDLDPYLRENVERSQGLYSKAINRLPDTHIDTCQIVPVIQQGNIHDCGYHSIFNLHQIQQALDVGMVPNVNLDLEGLNQELQTFISVAREELREEFNGNGQGVQGSADPIQKRKRSDNDNKESPTRSPKKPRINSLHQNIGGGR